MVLLAFMEKMRRQNNAEYRNFSLKTDLHHAVDNGSCHEIMSINTAIHHESCADDSRILAGLGQGFGMKGIS